MKLRQPDEIDVRQASDLMNLGEFSLLVLIGGGRSGALDEELIARYDLVIYADVPQSQALHRSRLQRIPNLILYPLGQGQTAMTLFATASLSQQLAVGTLARMNAEQGMGSLPGIGFQAVRVATQSPEHERLLQHVLDRVIIQTRGAPTRIRGRTCISDAGGTGAGDAVGLSRSFIVALSSHGLSVTWDYDVIGAVTFTGLAVRAGLNAASAEWRILRDLTRRPLRQCPLAVESLRLIEFQPFSHNQQERDAAVALDEQGWASMMLQQYLAMIQPNCAMNGIFGIATSWKQDRHELLDAITDVVPCVATTYKPQVDAALENSSPLLLRVEHVDAQATSTPLQQEALEELLERGLAANVLVAELQRPAAKLRYRLIVTTNSGQEFDLDRVQFDFQDKPRSLQECCDRLQLLNSMAAALDELLAIQSHEIDVLNEEAEDLAAFLHQQLPRLARGDSFWSRGQQKRRADFRAAAENLRQVANELHPKQALLLAYRDAKGNVGLEAAYLHDRLSALSKMLDGFCPRGKVTTAAHAPIIVRHIDQAFSRLIELPGSPRSSQRKALSQMTAAVTLPGLAKILRLPTARLDLIAERIAWGSYPVEGPPLGAKVERRQGQEIVVLPPLPVDYEDELPKLIRDLKPDLLVVVADTASAGVTVMKYTVYSADSLRELFPGRLWTDLRRAYEHPQRELFFPDGTEGLEEDLFEGDSQLEGGQAS